jgi:sugar phosphate isomerase/epimerase
LDRTFRASGKQRAGRIGKAVVRLMKARDAIEIMQALGAKDPAFVLCANPHCPDCVRQRADIRRDRFRRLPFQVAASALLAGRHAEDIVENCQAAGIDAVELDGLRGKPVPMLEAELVRRTVEQLRAGGCKVTALRLPASIREMEAVFALAAECGIPRVVLPLSAQSAGHARLAAAVKAAVSFCNLGLDGKSASDILVGLKAAGWDVGFTFSAAEFASSGEMPFRRSYKCKLRRYVDQLDVADALYDGTPQPLGEGNAEIKEMISILSAGGFAGTMVLAEGNRRVGTGALRDAVERFERLLVTM